MLDSVLSCTAIGSPATVKARMAAFIAETGADELMITSQIFDHQHRLRSYEITAQVHAELAAQPVTLLSRYISQRIPFSRPSAWTAGIFLLPASARKVHPPYHAWP